MTATSALSVSVVLAGCGSEQRSWWDYRESNTGAPVGDVVVETDTFRVSEDDADGGCAQLTVLDVEGRCSHDAAGFSAFAARVDDTHFVHVRADPPTREFVVWSSASPSGRSIEPILAAERAILVWILQPGEEPWGVQAIGSDGELVMSTSFEGLPAA